MSNKSKTRVKVEKYPLPPTVDGICSMIREILAPGLVQRIELDIDSPIRVTRSVPLEDGKELEDDDVDLEAVLRNIEMIEYTSENASPFQVIFDMMQLVNNEKLNPVFWVGGTGSEKLIDEWLELRTRGMPGGLNRLLGIPVQRIKSLSEDTLILCASLYPSAGVDELSLAVKTAIEIRRPSHDTQRTAPCGQVDDSVRRDSGASDSPAHQLAAVARGLHKVDWKPDGQS